MLLWKSLFRVLFAFQVIGAAGNLKLIGFERVFFLLCRLNSLSQLFKAIQVSEQLEN